MRSRNMNAVTRTGSDNLGDRIKGYEIEEMGETFRHDVPLIIRLDGRSFSNYTRHFDRPFDDAMSDAMCETTEMLVKESNALIGYTQSDEITLILYSDVSLRDGLSRVEMMFGGKKFKILSTLASMASVKFYTSLKEKKLVGFPDKLPSFDCRAFSVPSKMEAWNALLWRVNDALRNSVSGMAHFNFSHKLLQGKNRDQMIDMLLKEKGINWFDLPSKFREGRFVRTEKGLSTVKNRRTGEDTVVERSKMVELQLKSFKLISNREEFLFDKACPIYREE